MSEADLQAYLQKLTVYDRAMFAYEKLLFGFSPTLAIIEDTWRNREAIEKYRSMMDGLNTNEIMIGQAFGL